MADAHGLGPCVLGRRGSTPLSRRMAKLNRFHGASSEFVEEAKLRVQ